MERRGKLMSEPIFLVINYSKGPLLKEMLISNPAITAATSGFRLIGRNFKVSSVQFSSSGTLSG